MRQVGPGDGWEKVGLGRRLMAMLYDTVALFGVLYCAALLPVVAGGGQPPRPGNPWFFCYLLMVGFVYFGFCWTRGRTLGMQAWRLEIRRLDGTFPIWSDALLRFAAAAISLSLGGLGYWVSLLHPQGSTWPDRVSKTQLWRAPAMPASASGRR